MKSWQNKKVKEVSRHSDEESVQSYEEISRPINININMNRRKSLSRLRKEGEERVSVHIEGKERAKVRTEREHYTI